MFLRRYTRTKDGKTHTYYALVESVRTDAGPRQHTVAYLGELNHDEQKRWQRTVSIYNRQGDCQQLRLFPDDDQVPVPDDDPDVVRIRLRSVGWTNPRRFGDVWLGLWLWKFLHLDEIVDRHVPQGKETIRPADIVAIEVINRLCGPCSEFALAEHWYASTALEDLLGVPDSAVTKDRLYRTLDRLLRAQEPIENDLKDRLGTLFQLDYDLLLYDLTSTYFEGLAEENDLARRGYSRDHRSDCKQIVLALVVTREGFPLAHLTLAGNTQDVQTVEMIVRDGRDAVRSITADLGNGPGHDQQGHPQAPEPIRPALSAGHPTRRVEFVRRGIAQRRLETTRRQPRCRSEAAQAEQGAIPACEESAPAAEGAGNSPPSAARDGQGFAKTPAANPGWSVEEARQDPRVRRHDQGSFP